MEQQEGLGNISILLFIDFQQNHIVMTRSLCYCPTNFLLVIEVDTYEVWCRVMCKSGTQFEHQLDYFTCDFEYIRRIVIYCDNDIAMFFHIIQPLNLIDFFIFLTILALG